MTQKQLSPEEMAAQQEEAEESARRESRRKALAESERQRRQQESREAEKIQAREKAADEAASLVESREPLEAKIASLIAELASEVEELSALHDKHVKSLQASLDPEWNIPVHDGIRLGSTPLWAQGRAPDVRQTVRSYLEGSLPALYPNAKTPQGSLSEVDLLSPVDSDDGAGRPLGPFPWDKLEEAKAEISARDDAERERGRAAEAAGKIRQLQARHADLRARYARPISFAELVPSEELGDLEALFTEAEMELARSIVEARV